MNKDKVSHPVFPNINLKFSNNLYNVLLFSNEGRSELVIKLSLTSPHKESPLPLLSDHALCGFHEGWRLFWSNMNVTHILVINDVYELLWTYIKILLVIKSSCTRKEATLSQRCLISIYRQFTLCVNVLNKSYKPFCFLMSSTLRWPEITLSFPPNWGSSSLTLGWVTCQWGHTVHSGPLLATCTHWVQQACLVSAGIR